MRGNIIRRINCDICDDCEAVGLTLVIQGETDSFGFEEIHLCEACHEAAEREEQDYLEALDTPETPGCWLLSASSQDDVHETCSVHHTLRAAVAARRCFERRCEPRGGIYPREGAVRDFSDRPEEAARIARGWRPWWEDEEDEEDEVDPDPWFDPRWGSWEPGPYDDEPTEVGS